MRFVMISPTNVIDLEKIERSVRVAPDLHVFMISGKHLTFTGDEACVLWDQITQEAQVAEPSSMFSAVQEVARCVEAMHPNDIAAARMYCDGLFSAIRQLRAAFKV